MNKDIYGDEWTKIEEICFNCEHMSYFDDGYCLIEIEPILLLDSPE